MAQEVGQDILSDSSQSCVSKTCSVMDYRVNLVVAHNCQNTLLFDSVKRRLT